MLGPTRQAGWRCGSRTWPRPGRRPSTQARASCAGSSGTCTTARRPGWSLGMTLDAADQQLETDPPRRGRCSPRRASAATALAELRDLVRGIHPPVLADRGLPGGPRARRAWRCRCRSTARSGRRPRRWSPPPTSRRRGPDERDQARGAGHAWIDLPQRAAAYCGSASATTGAAARACARRRPAGDRAPARRVRRHARAVQPAGRPHRVNIVMPCASSSPKTSSCSGTG